MKILSKGHSIAVIGLVALTALVFLSQNNRSTNEQKQPSGETLFVSTPTPSTTSSSSGQALDVIDEAGIANAVEKITQALKAPNASQLQSLLLNDVVVSTYSGGQTGETTNKQEVTNWLNTHWGNNLHYVSRHYVAHFGYWEIVTTGWKDIPSGEVDFRLFRYDAQGQRSVSEGDWMIYVVIY